MTLDSTRRGYARRACDTLARLRTTNSAWSRRMNLHRGQFLRRLRAGRVSAVK
jgi:hypothetical protein